MLAWMGSRIAVPSLVVTGFRSRLARGACRGRVLCLAAFIASALLATPAMAQEQASDRVPAASSAAPVSPWSLHLDLDTALFLHSRSKAIGHLLKPAARLTIERPWRQGPVPKLRVGAQAFAILDTSSHYRVWALALSALYPLVEGSRFELSANASVGASLNADILHSDLKAGVPVLPYAAIGLRGAWKLSTEFHLGVQLYWSELSIVSLGLGATLVL